MLNISITGKRPRNLYGYNDRAAYRPLAEAICAALTEIAETWTASTGETEVCVHTGGAQGTDQLAFRVVDSLLKKNDTARTWTNHLFIPFVGQEGRWAEAGMFSKERYRDMISRADTVTDCSEDFASENAVARLMHRNEVMSSGCDICVAVHPHDNLDAPNGGTRSTIRYCRDKLHIPVVVIDPATFEVVTLTPATEPENVDRTELY